MNIWILFLLIMALSFVVQRVLESRFDKYSRVPSPNGMTGADVARMMLERNGIRDVTVQSVAGKLTDHFDPRNKTVNLSEGVYGSSSIAACAVAAHETGHAIQHAKGYAPLRFRSALVPVVDFANKTVQWVILAGVLLMTFTPYLFWLGIALFAMTTLFSLITLPVEIDASRRAVEWLDSAGIVGGETREMAADALKGAAYTYVIAALGSLATLIYYISIGNSRR